MPNHQLHLDIAWLSIEKAAVLGLPPRFPELSELGPARSRIRQRLARNAARILADTPISEIHRRLLGTMPASGEVTVNLEPPERGSDRCVFSAWRTTAPLRFHYVFWDHGAEAVVACVPVLDIEVVCRRREDLPRLLQSEILFALRRSGLGISLEYVCRLDRYKSIRIERLPMEVEIKTPKQLAQTERDRTKRVLPEVATNLCRGAGAPVVEVEPLLERLGDYLAGNQRSSVLLVGPSGVGKTALVSELARRRAHFGLATRPFWSTSGARLVAGMVGFSMWQDRCQAVCREAGKTGSVVHLGNLMELADVGKCSASDQGVADFLRPFIERGELLAIAECTPEQQTILHRDMPGLLQAFSQIEVRPPSDRQGLAILEKLARVWSRPRRLTVTGDAVNTLDRLHRRYATYSVYPGRPLRFLRGLLESAPEDSTVDASLVTAAFSRETGLPRVLLDQRQPLDPDTVRGWLGERLIGQDAAIDVVIDLLASVKANLTRPDRPIASLMFIGPTGVGKTEMAKCLAEFLFQDRQRLIRMDMSEYADSISVERLIGGAWGSEGVLTARVRQQPFAIVLFDEFEKAHPSFFDLLLQVLGEGRLTDGSGRLADFRSTVVVMTSNLGSESFGRQRVGFDDRNRSARGAEQHFLRQVELSVRPEFFNRIDRVVPFLPLSETALEKIARRQLELLHRREGICRRDLELHFTDALVGEIVRLGYDPRYGARPIQRAIDRHLLTPLADAVNAYPAEVPLRATIDAVDRQVRVRAKALAERDSRELTDVRQRASRLACSVADLRREAFRLRESHVILGFQNRLHRRESIETRRRNKARRAAALGRHVLPPDPALIVEIETLRNEIGRANRLAESFAELEECALVEYYAGRWTAVAELEHDLSQLRSRLEATYLDLFARCDLAPDRVTIVVYGQSSHRMLELARAYFDLAHGRQYEVSLYPILPRVDPVPAERGWFLLGAQHSRIEKPGRQTHGTRLMAKKESEWGSLPAESNRRVVGLGLEIHGPLAKLLLEPESGLHVFGAGAGRVRCLVDTTPVPLIEYQPPSKIDTPGGLRDRAVRRIYCDQSESIEDKRLGRRLFWKGKQLAGALESLIAEYLFVRAKEWAGEN